jgi:Flp pilus assembly protein TadD
MTMIKKALESRPNDGYIVDSLGWAYYQVGEYHNAAESLEKAVELVSGDSIITDHLGDALFYSGRKIEAKFQWKRALEFDPQEDLILQLNNKIKGLIIPKPGVKAPSSKNM